MGAVYAETSSILAWLFSERVGRVAMDVINSAERIICSDLLRIEVRRAFIRAYHQKEISRTQHQELLTLFEDKASGWYFMDITPAIKERASNPFPIEPLRTLDAIHLSTALQLLAAYPELKVLSFDKRITDNLAPLGLRSATADQ